MTHTMKALALASGPMLVGGTALAAGPAQAAGPVVPAVGHHLDCRVAPGPVHPRLHQAEGRLDMGEAQGLPPLPPPADDKQTPSSSKKPSSSR